MRFRLYVACADGIPLSGRDILAGGSCRGELSIEDAPEPLRGRFTRVARFRRFDIDKREARRPLYEPVLANVGERHLELSGFEYSQVEGQASYQMQRWILIDIADGPLTDWPPETSRRRINLCSPTGRF
jgi:hypothetical protein